MDTVSSPHRYSAVTRAFHWLTAVLVVVAFVYGPGGPEQRVYSAARDADRHLHETLGLTVLALSVLRGLWRAFLDRAAPPLPPSAPWMKTAARAVQGALYVLLFAVPLTAITGAWLEGHPLTLLGGIVIDPPWGPSPALHAWGATVAEAHGWLGDVILWVAGAHAAAALAHHYLLRDDVLRSMLPGRDGR